MAPNQKGHDSGNTYSKVSIKFHVGGYLRFLNYETPCRFICYKAAPMWHTTLNNPLRNRHGVFAIFRQLIPKENRHWIFDVVKGPKLNYPSPKNTPLVSCLYK